MVWYGTGMVCAMSVPQALLQLCHACCGPVIDVAFCFRIATQASYVQDVQVDAAELEAKRAEEVRLEPKM